MRIAVSPAAWQIVVSARDTMHRKSWRGPRKWGDQASALNVVQQRGLFCSSAINTGDPVAELDRALSALRAADSSMKAHESRARAGIRNAGYALPNGWGRRPLEGDWAGLRGRTPKQLWDSLLDFPEWAQRNRISPSAVDGAVLERFEQFRLTARAKSGKRRNPTHERRRFLAVVDAWAKIQVIIGGKPPVDLPQRAYGDYRYRLADEAWSSELIAEVEQGAKTIADARLPWSASGQGRIDRVIDELLRLASAYCIIYNFDPKLMSLALLVDADSLKPLLEFSVARSRERNPTKHAAAAYQRICLICSVAELHLGVDSDTLTKLEQLRRDYAPEFSLRLPLEREARLARFADPVLARRLRSLPRRTLAPGDAPPAPLVPDLTTAQAAIALEFAFVFGMYPSQCAGCVVRSSRDPAHTKAPAEIIEDPDSGTVQLHTRSSRRGAERWDWVTGTALSLYRRYRALVQTVRPDARGYLLPGRKAGPRNPAGLSRAIAALTAADEVIAEPITAGDLPAIAAILIMNHPDGSRELARRRLGRSLRPIDPLLDAIEIWQSVADSDELIAGPAPFHPELCSGTNEDGTQS